MSERPNCTLEQLADAVAAGDVDTVVAVFPDLYGRLLGKRFEAHFFLENVAQAGTHGCDYLLTVDMEMEPVAGYRSANWERGYGDFHLVPDLSTLRRAGWLDRTALVLCDIKDERTHEPVPQAPRTMLRRQVERAAEQGLTVQAGSEIEYYIFTDDYRAAAAKQYRELEAAGWYIEDYHTLQGGRVESINAAARRELTAAGIPVECTKGEWGQGQHELNLRFCQVLEMADRHTIYKQCLKEIAQAEGMSVTYMAKYSAEHAGSSCHLHISLWQGTTNAFVGEQPLVPHTEQAPQVGTNAAGVSDEFRWFLGGWLHHAADTMAFYAPTVNSYKRFQVGSWAPTRLAWGRDNRTAGFRVVGSGNSLRIECRIPGADCNPYLVYAAALAAGLDGIAQHIEPPPMFSGNAYTASEYEHVPDTLGAAAHRLSTSCFARDAFGPEVVEHYVHFYQTEQQAYNRAVTDWERARYFERI